MATFQVISDKNKPKFAILPFGDEEAIQDYIDELWAEKAVAEYNKNKQEKIYTLNEAKKKLDYKKRQNTAIKIKKKKVKA